MSLFKRGIHELGRALRETGTAIDRIGRWTGLYARSCRVYPRPPGHPYYAPTRARARGGTRVVRTASLRVPAHFVNVRACVPTLCVVACRSARVGEAHL